MAWLRRTMAVTPAPDQGRGVGHGPHHRRRLGQGRLQAWPASPATIESTRGHPDGAEHAAGRLGDVGLDGQHGPAGVGARA